jgi:hypothetical protein
MPYARGFVRIAENLERLGIKRDGTQRRVQQEESNPDLAGGVLPFVSSSSAPTCVRGLFLIAEGAS